MPSATQGSVAIPISPVVSFESANISSRTPSKPTRPRSPSCVKAESRPKKHRASLSQDKENAFASSSYLGPLKKSSSKDTAMHREPMGLDEKAMMDELMAGLDASMFDGFDLTPAKSGHSSHSSVSPVKVKNEKRTMDCLFSTPRQAEKKPRRESWSTKSSPNGNTADTKRRLPALRPVNSQPKVSLHIKVEVDEPIQRELAPYVVKSEILEAPIPNHAEAKPSPDDFDDEVYDFGFDLTDVSLFSDDLLLPQPKTRYPILNPAVPAPPVGYAPTPWRRCTVKAIAGGLKTWENEAFGEAAPGAGKTLLVVSSKDDVQLLIHLKERWADAAIRKGDTVNIISPSLDRSADQPIIITFKDPQSFLIHHPDLLLTMTSIANAMPCPRKPLLQALTKIPGPPNKPILYGNILHGLLQGAMMEQSFGEKETYARLGQELKKEDMRLQIWGAGMETGDVREEAGAKAGKGFETFGDKWVKETPTSDGGLHANPGETPSLLAISGLHDVEEDIWSPKWGLKGKVDASVQAKITTDPGGTTESTAENVAPLEIKTGRSVGILAHRAQTMLYTLLMEDRYATPIPAGLLYYSQLDTILRVEARPNEIRALVIARNELAGYLNMKRMPQSRAREDSVIPPSQVDLEETPFLPATIDHPRECRTCHAVDTCMLYRKAVDQVDASDQDPIAELYEEKTGHMSNKDAVFFKHWERLLSIEEQDIGKFRSQLWTMTAKEREKTGKCFGDMIISSYSNDIGKSLAKIHRHAYTFVRAPHAGTQASNASLLSGHIAKGDPVSLSIEPDLLCLSRGFVLELTPTQITIGVTFKIDVKALLARTQHQTRALGGIRDDETVFRIDKDEMASGMSRMRNNLAQLFYKDGDEQRRRLVVDLEVPRFEKARRAKPEETTDTLNGDQRQAMDKVLMARDYALILGMPGTGKTTTIAEIIKTLVARGKSVLLTSYTHSAVDTILMKLVNADFQMLRLGNIDKVHPDVQHLTLEAYEASTSMAQLNSRMMDPPVVAATCLSIEHPMFFKRKFDYCIVDEASQITLPTCLGPLRMADTFVLVGDHFQLPPIVRNSDARKGGLDVSLFKLLSSAHPSAVVDLSHQYRMNEDIMTLSNRLIYENKLKCGSEQVAKQSLVLKDPKGCGAGCEDCWIKSLLKESVKAVFVDTDRLPAFDERIGDLVQNPTEAKLVQQLAVALTNNGINQEDIAVITPYRQQIKLLTGLFRPFDKIEILTADKSQGRDKDCILISLVRSNEGGSIGELLRDWRRINVSFTRAKKKLVIFGSRKTLGQDLLMKGFFELMEEKKWIMELAQGADEIHTERGETRSKEEIAAEEKTQLKGEVVKVEGGENAPAGRRGKGRVGHDGILKGRPFIREVLGSE
ncbi:DNA replication ATP-dependent helicase/nuclease Dna2, partial [Tremellales sp. Uapishka_1]